MAATHTHSRGVNGWTSGPPHRGEALCVCSLAGGVARSCFPPAAAFEDGAKIPRGPALALSEGRAQWSEVAVLWHSLLVLLVGAGAAWVEPGRWCIHPLSSPHPSDWGGQHPFLRSFCAHHHKVYGVSCIMMHAVLCLARAFSFFPWKAPETLEMQKEIQKVSLLFSLNRSSSRATLQINTVRQGFEKSFGEPSPSLYLSHMD